MIDVIYNKIPKSRLFSIISRFFDSFFLSKQHASLFENLFFWSIMKIISERDSTFSMSIHKLRAGKRSFPLPEKYWAQTDLISRGMKVECSSKIETMYLFPSFFEESRFISLNFLYTCSVVEPIKNYKYSKHSQIVTSNRSYDGFLSGVWNPPYENFVIC